MTVGFTPPHPMAVMRVLKQAFRDYLVSGTGATIAVTTPPTQAHTAVTVVAGTVTVDLDGGVVLPLTVTALLTQGGTTKATQTAPVTPVTGAFTTTFAANTLAAGTATATVSSVDLAGETTTTPAFTLT